MQNRFDDNYNSDGETVNLYGVESPEVTQGSDEVALPDVSPLDYGETYSYGEVDESVAKVFVKSNNYTYPPVNFDATEDQGQNMNVNHLKEELKKKETPLYDTKTFLPGRLLTSLK